MNYEARWIPAALLLSVGIGCGSPSDADASHGGASAAAGGAPSAGGAPGTQGVGAAGTQAGGADAAGGIGMAGGAGSSGSATSNLGGAGNAAGGMSGSAGAGAAAGAAGSASQEQLDEAELSTALAQLDGFVYANACKFGSTGGDLSTLNNCMPTDICWATKDLGQFSEKKQIPIGGSAGHVYQVDVNVLGVMEPRDYPAPPNCLRLPGQPAETAGTLQCMDGFANKDATQYNVWELSVPAPANKYYLNGVPEHPFHRVDVVDNRFTFHVNAGSTITFTMDDLNGGEIRNCSNKLTVSKYKTARGAAVNAPAGLVQPFNGNWLQLSVLDAKVVH